MLVFLGYCDNHDVNSLDHQKPMPTCINISAL